MVQRWQEMARRTLLTAQLAYNTDDWRSAASRAYYAVYQMATGICIEHEDSDRFPVGWNNPAHDQLPKLIQNNGDILPTVRQRITQRLVELRVTRESADYRPGRTVDKAMALECLQKAILIIALLEK